MKEADYSMPRSAAAVEKFFQLSLLGMVASGFLAVAGSGYATAILAEMMPVNAAIRSIEIIPELASRARRVLAELGYQNVEIRVGDGALGWPEAAPFDAILVSAAPPEVPPALLAQLASGGRMVLPVGRSPEQQELQLWRRAPAGGFEKRTLMQVRFVPLTGSSQHNLH